MDRREARQRVKQQLEHYLTARGLPVRRPFNCLNPAHEDRHPSMSFDRRRDKVHCFSCGADYDLFDLIGLEYNLTQAADIFAKAYELYGLSAAPLSGGLVSGSLVSGGRPAEGLERRPGPDPPPRADLGAYLRNCRGRLESTDYPARRGLSAATCERFGLGFDPKFRPGRGEEFWAALIIPTGPGCFTARNTDPQAAENDRIRKRGGSPVFNAEAVWNAAKPVFVVEGEIDALALAEIGAEAVALGSTAGVGAFLKLLASRPPVQPLLLALDNDPPGRAATEKLAGGLRELGIVFYQTEPYGDFKDAGEALVKADEDLTAAVREAENIEVMSRQIERAAYLATSAAYHLAAFKNGAAAEVATAAWPTGFARLDQQLEGGLYEGLYILGGISSLGKTSLALQFSDQLAESGREVLIFSLEMARGELMAKSLSRLTLLHSLKTGQGGVWAKTARGLTDNGRYLGYGPEELAAIAAALKNYEDFARRIFISEGAGDLGPREIRREVEKHLRHTGRQPAVVVDYLQILAPHSSRSSDKQNTDQAVLELKRISRDFKIPVIALSSFNRAGYRETATMESFKESGAIEYSSDVLWGLQLKGAGEKDFDAPAAKEKNPREVELVTLKNRHGPAGGRAPLEYYPKFNYFREL